MDSNQEGQVVDNQEEVNRIIWTKPTEEWEFETVGRFLIDLYKRKIISRYEQWLVNKGQVRQEFERFLREPENNGVREKFHESLGSFNIGNLLDRCKFLINTKRGSNKYKINYTQLFREEMLAIYEKNHLDGQQAAAEGDTTLSAEDLNGKWQELEYMGTDMQGLNSLSERHHKWHCMICQLNFNNSSAYHGHMQRHSTPNDFLWAKKFGTSVLTVCSQSCKNAEKMYFKLECTLPNRERLFVDKILLLKGHSVCCVPQTSTISFATSTNKIFNKNIFCIDKQMLNSFGKQTFIFIVRDQVKKDVRIVEQHNYMPQPEFEDKKIRIIRKINTHLNNSRVCEAKENLMEHFPSEEMENDYGKFCEKQDVSILNKSHEFSDYILSGKKLTVQNIQGTMKFLLQMEDIERFTNAKLLGKNIELQRHNTNNTYVFKITLDNFTEENLLQFDTVYLYNIQHKKKDENNLLTICRNSTQKPYRGQINGYENGYIRFTTSNQDISLKQKYTVYGCMARLTLKLQYRAIELLNTWSALDINRFLFPQFIKPQDLPQNCLILQNAKLYKDADQLQAIQNICEGPHKDATYIIDGPGGTGKTSIIIETIVQLHERKPNTKILVLAPNEHACDEIALPLSKILTELQKLEDMSRIYSHLHQLQERHLENEDYLNLLKASNLCEKFFYPAIDDLHQRRIIICTLKVAGSLSLGGFGRDDNTTGVFTHVFVDNATMCTEPEILMAVVNVLSPQASLILAGDTKQQPTHIYAKHAAELGLGMPLMQRLMQRECYKVINGNSSSICTRLVRNYRSHPEIIDLCNRVYNYKMLPMTNVGELSVYGNWFKLPNPMQPILFHHVVNTDSTLWNSLEVALTYIKEFMYFGIGDDKEFSQNDIGIIINEKFGLKYLSDELKLRDWDAIEVDTLDNFTGREKNIIICVLNLGAENSDIKNLNTMILIAKSILIIIGDTKDNKDIYVESFISLCRNRKMLIMENELPDLKQTFNDLKINEIDDEFQGAMSSVSLVNNNDNGKPKPKPINNHQPHLARSMKKGGYNAQKSHTNSDMLKELMHKGTNNKNNHNKMNKDTGAVSKPRAGFQSQNKYKRSVPPNKTIPAQASKDKKLGQEAQNVNSQNINYNKNNPNNNNINKTAMAQQQFGNNAGIPINNYGGVSYPQQFQHPPPPPAYPGQQNYGNVFPSPQQQYNQQQQQQHFHQQQHQQPFNQQPQQQLLYPQLSNGATRPAVPANQKSAMPNANNNKVNSSANQQQPQQQQQQPQQQQQQPQQAASSSSQLPTYNDIFRSTSDRRTFGEAERRRRQKYAAQAKPECIIA